MGQNNRKNCFRYGKITSENIHFVTNSEAELVKLYRNNFLALKVSFSNEIAEFCQKLNIKYENVRKIAVLDNRIHESHTNVPGHDGKKGFGGTCFPKDTKSLLFEMKRINMESYVVNAMITRNEKIDRPENDWNENKGRAVI